MARYIDADKALKDLPNDLPYKGSVKRVLIQAPTADVVEVKHGEWIEEGNKHTCSCCGYCHILFGIPKHKYCQNCGAKMYIERKEERNDKRRNKTSYAQFYTNYV